LATISSGLCFFWGIPASSKWLKSHTSRRTTFQGADQVLDHNTAGSVKLERADHVTKHLAANTLVAEKQAVPQKGNGLTFIR
jgi:hypothetical protein